MLAALAELKEVSPDALDARYDGAPKRDLSELDVLAAVDVNFGAVHV